MYARLDVDGTPGDQRRASVFEIVGVWLHVWTAPRDVVIPPVPWRKLALWTGVAVVVLGVALAVMIPRINAGKEKRAAASAAEQARAQKVNRERIIRLQQPRTGSAADLKPAAGAPLTERLAARDRLVAGVEAAITADATARGAKGEMSKVQGPTTCELAPGAATSGEVGVFDCYTVVRKVPKVETNLAGSIGYPFRAVVHYDTYKYTFCRIEQFPGEQLIPDPRTVVQLPAACRGT
jgi:type II secretory pathway pseudopilin PulG